MKFWQRIRRWYDNLGKSPANEAEIKHTRQSLEKAVAERMMFCSDMMPVKSPIEVLRGMLEQGRAVRRMRDATEKPMETRLLALPHRLPEGSFT